MACSCLCWKIYLQPANITPGVTYNLKYIDCTTGLLVTIPYNPYASNPALTPNNSVVICTLPTGFAGGIINNPLIFNADTDAIVNTNADPYDFAFNIVNCLNPDDTLLISSNLWPYNNTGTVLQFAEFPGCWTNVLYTTVCEIIQPGTVTNTFATCEKCFEGGSCYLLTNCNPLAVPAIIVTSTDLSLNLGSVVTLVDRPGCWTVSTSPTCEGSVAVTVIQTYTNCETCNQEYVTFVSCCGGFELHFVRNLITIPTYLVNNTVYVYNGSLYTDGLNTMYPGQCYTYKNTFSSALLPTFAVPPFASFTSTGVTTGNCSSVVSLCDHCFYKLTNCDIDNDVIYTYTDLSASIGDIITITGYPDICWIVSESDTAILPVVVTPVGISYATCLDCKGYFFTINDCCTDEPYLVNGVPLVLEYHGLSNPGFSPADLSTQIITTINLPNGNSITGCFYIVDVTTASRSSVAQSQIVIDWDTDLEFVTVPTCADCQSCNTCYLLTNCVTGESEYITGTDLLQYIGGVITIAGCKDQCWIVTQAENCDGCGGAVTVLSYFPATDPAVRQICTYAFDIKPLTITSATIVIDGTTYPLAITALLDLIPAINALALGTAYVGNGGAIPLMGIIGDYVYGSVCLTGNSGGPTTTTCFTPVCTNFINNCTYSTLTTDGGTIPDRTVTITINGIVHTTVLTASNISKLLIWLNSLGLGFFTATIVGTNCTIQVFGNATYGNIVIGSDTLTTLTPTCTTITSTPCDLCLPQPIPEPPVVLNTRFVKPGYRTPSCSPEYTERVNCNYGDQLYNRMLSARYGLTVCCDEAFDKWLIKKELLDLDSIRNTEFNCCPPVPVCNTCNSQACNCPIVYPDCYCWSFNLGADCIVTTICNGITETKPYAGGLHQVCSEVKPFTDPSCKQVIDPVYLGPCSDSCVTPPCVCYQLDINARAATISYTDCEGNPATTPGQFGSDNYVCSITAPTVLNGPYTLMVLPNDCTLGECVAPCLTTCYDVTLNCNIGKLDCGYSYTTCEGGQVFGFVQNGTIFHELICSTTVPLGVNLIAIPVVGIDCIDCNGPLPPPPPPL